MMYPKSRAKPMNPKKKYVCAVCKSPCDLYGLFFHMKQVSILYAKLVDFPSFEIVLVQELFFYWFFAGSSRSSMLLLYEAFQKSEWFGNSYQKRASGTQKILPQYQTVYQCLWIEVQLGLFSLLRYHSCEENWPTFVQHFCQKTFR